MLYRKLVARAFHAFLFAGLFLCLPASLKAWGLLGHRIVGGIADLYLTKKAKDEVKKILGNETIAIASNWADFIKSDTSYKYLSAWHYIDFEGDLTYGQMEEYLKTGKAADAYTRLNFLIKELRNKSLPQAKKQMYLRLLIHIAGDVHQPFHVSQKGDNGGNNLNVFWFGNATNIHRVWDEQLIDFQQLSFTEYINAINFTTLRQRMQWQKDPVSQWLFESYTISTRLRKELGQGDLKLGYSYNFKNIGIVNEQLLKGGIRLAGLLNSIFS